MMWLISIFFAVLIASFLNYFVRAYSINIWNIKIIIGCIPIIMVVNYLYWYGYMKANSFLICWVVCIAIGAIISFFIDLFLLKEVVFNIKVISGIGFIIVGSFLLNWK